MCLFINLWNVLAWILYILSSWLQLQMLLSVCHCFKAFILGQASLLYLVWTQLQRALPPGQPQVSPFVDFFHGAGHSGLVLTKIKISLCRVGRERFWVMVIAVTVTRCWCFPYCVLNAVLTSPWSDCVWYPQTRWLKYKRENGMIIDVSCAFILWLIVWHSIQSSSMSVFLVQEMGYSSISVLIKSNRTG